MDLTLKDLAVIYNALNAQKSNIENLPPAGRSERVINDINSVLKKYDKIEVE